VTRRAALLVLVSLGVWAGIHCSSPPARPAASASAGRGEPSTDAGALPELEPGPPIAPTALARDRLWQRAGDGDPIDLQRLADREGSLGLLAGVELGRSLGLTGLKALPYAEDGELALGRLCELARRLDGSGRHSVLIAIRGVVAAIAPDRERLAAEEFAPCARALARIAADQRVPAADRDLASSSAAGLTDYVKPSAPP
jgi:hypothetical protein